MSLALPSRSRPSSRCTGWLPRTAFGRDFRASAADAEAAATIGVDVNRVRMLTFALGAACAGVGGTLIGTAFQFSPSSGGAYLLNSLAIVVLGGLGNVLGTLFGGLALGALAEPWRPRARRRLSRPRRHGALPARPCFPARRLSRGGADEARKVRACAARSRSHPRWPSPSCGSRPPLSATMGCKLPSAS